MRMPRLVVALFLFLVGLVWIGQGVGLIGGSVMSGSLFWAAVGLVLIGIALAIVVRERRPSSKG
jgi:glucose dehydrogenase